MTYKVYVCFHESAFDGGSPPEVAFATEGDAKEFCQQQGSSVFEGYDYRELEVHE